MPTPFTHLRFAQDILARNGLPLPLQSALNAELPAFWLGNLAPDAQTVSGQTREATHFFSVPFSEPGPACQHLFAAHPALARPWQLPRPQAAFVAGYVLHLALDEFWVRAVFEPYFGSAARWGTLPERLYLHNALRSHLDMSDLRRLSPDLAPTLRQACPQGWCPFIRDESLAQWQDVIAAQLAPGPGSRTVAVFAERMGADPHQFAALLASPDGMQRRVFDRLPPGLLEHYAEAGLTLGGETLAQYWAGML